MANIMKSILGAFVEVADEESDVGTVDAVSKVVAAPASVPVATPVPDSDTPTQQEAQDAQTLAFSLANYQSVPQLQRFMVMEAKSRVEDPAARTQAVLEALADAADIPSATVISQANAAQSSLRTGAAAHATKVRADIVALDVEQAKEAKDLETAIAADLAQIQAITARMDRARADAASITSRYAAKKAVVVRGLDVFTAVSNQILTKWDLLTKKSPS